MKGMFASCVSLKNINIKNFKTSKVKNMAQMFYKCFNLKEGEELLCRAIEEQRKFTKLADQINRILRNDYTK